MTLLLGSLIAYRLADQVDVAFLIPFAAGNFVYIAAADLLPELTSSRKWRDNLVHTAGFATGLGVLLAVAAAT